MKSIHRIFILLFLISSSLFAQKKAFDVVPLGVKGGIDETNLSAYLVAPKNTNEFI